MEKGLKINVNSLAADPVPVIAEMDPGLFELGSEGIVRDPVRVNVNVHRLGEKVYIRGRIETTVQLQCSRCLRELYQPVESPLVLLAVPANQVTEGQSPATAEGAEKDDAVGIVYNGDQLDLTPEIENILTLALPMKPLCSDQCPGLCPRCGAGLAEGACECNRSDEGPDSRESGGPFSALKKWHP
ncbi:MAG: DUF177 domain-containing protein [candidate division FCPU426 bacterium]